MTNLIRIELKKVFKKKSVYITTGILIGLICLITVMINFQNYSIYSDMTFDDMNISDYRNELESLDPNNPNDLNDYVTAKTNVDLYEFMKSYPTDSWQRNYALEEVGDLIRNIYEEKYIFQDEEKTALLEKQLNEIKTKFDNNDWKYFEKNHIDSYEIKIKELEQNISLMTNEKEIEVIKKEIEETKVLLYISKYRIENDIDYSNSYLNNALNNYQSVKLSLLDYDKKITDKDNKDYIQLLQEEQTNKYILDNKIDLNNSKNAKNIFESTIEDYAFIFVIFIIMIAGAMISDEFNKGTIKMILVRPYKRWQILTSKYITCIIMYLYIIAVTLVSQFLIGGIVFGFGSYADPTVVYDYSRNIMVEMPVIKYQLISLGAILPQLILLMTLAFSISTIFTSTAIALTITFLVTFLSSTINQLIIFSDKEIFKFFPTMCWNLQEFLFGGKPTFKYLTMTGCIITSIVYLIIMLVVDYIVFNKKNVKNI